jgi:hypothetical protein
MGLFNSLHLLSTLSLALLVASVSSEDVIPLFKIQHFKLSQLLVRKVYLDCTRYDANLHSLLSTAGAKQLRHDQVRFVSAVITDVTLSNISPVTEEQLCSNSPSAGCDRPCLKLASLQSQTTPLTQLLPLENPSMGRSELSRIAQWQVT